MPRSLDRKRARVAAASPATSTLLCALLCCACSGSLQRSDAGCEGSSCDADLTSDDGIPPCDGGECDDGGEVEPCDIMVCPPNQSCVDGKCLTEDLCADLECPGEGEVCDPRTGSCVAGTMDDDGDGVTIAGGDCDDGDSLRYPGAEELCDGIDQDCDGVTDNGFPDSDGDGFDTCGSGTTAQADCDDDDSERYPGRVEICDGVDQDCDGTIDEDVTRPCSTACGDGLDRCDHGDWFCSVPDVCDCVTVGARETAPCGNCGTLSRECTESLLWTEWSDCEDEGCEPGTQGTCATSCGSVGFTSCTESCEWGSCGPPIETCNRRDDDCDGMIDSSSCLVRVYRFFNGVTGDHMYKAGTTIADEGYTWEQMTEFWVYRDTFPGSTPLIQRFDGTDHMLVIDPREGNDSGYVYESTLGYVVLTPDPSQVTEAAADLSSQTICRYVSHETGDHFVFTYLTAQEIEDLGMPYILESCPIDVWGWYFDWPPPSP